MSPIAEAARATLVSQQKSRAFWLKHLHQWHWISAAGCLIGLILFSITGFTLNHANIIKAEPKVTSKTAELPAGLLQELQAGSAASDEAARPLPQTIARWLQEEFAIQPAADKIEWSDDEVYISLPRPGGDAWLTVDLESGLVTHEITDRGWISYFNDLHKGRNAGPAWSLFIDIFAFAALIFAVTGLFLLKMHAVHRPATWPMVGLGLVLPLLLAILFIH